MNESSKQHFSIELSYNVIMSKYINSSEPDMTRVTVRLPPQPRENRTYICTVSVEGRVNISSGNYMPVTMGSKFSTVKVTGEVAFNVLYYMW